MTKTKVEATENAANDREFRNLSDLLAAPAGEGMELIARVAPAIDRVAQKTGLLDLLIEKQGTAETMDEAASILKEFLSALLRYGLGECSDDMIEIIAAINNMSADELKEKYTTWELINMIKAVISDKGFFTSVQTLMS